MSTLSYEKPNERSARAAPCNPLAVTIREASRLTGLGRTTLYQLIAGKKLKLKKIGRRSLIVFQSLRELIEEAEDA